MIKFIFTLIFLFLLSCNATQYLFRKANWGITSEEIIKKEGDAKKFIIKSNFDPGMKKIRYLNFNVAGLKSWVEYIFDHNILKEILIYNPVKRSRDVKLEKDKRLADQYHKKWRSYLIKKYGANYKTKMLNITSENRRTLVWSKGKTTILLYRNYICVFVRYIHGGIPAYMTDK